MNLPEALQLRDEAMASVDAHATDDWKEIIEQGIRRTALRLRTFTSFDVLTTLGGQWPEGADPRAVGPAMKRMEKAGIIEPTNDYRPNPYRHATPSLVWRSLVN